MKATIIMHCQAYRLISAYLLLSTGLHAVNISIILNNMPVWYCILIYDAFSLYKCLDILRKRLYVTGNWKVFLTVGIGVIAAVTAVVLLVVGSVLSTPNGKYACLNIVVVPEVCSSNICFSMVLVYLAGLVKPV